MPSIREQALGGLFLCLQTNLTVPSVLRNEVLPTAIPDGGLVILRDGYSGSAEISLSPVRYIYDHRAELEVFVQETDTNVRDQALDTLMSEIGTALAGNPTLSGTVDHARVGGPEMITEPIDGAAAVKAALVPVYLEYSTPNPLT